jgi:monofunctional biosynthetic peptidoglycan transglycosylase
VKRVFKRLLKWLVMLVLLLVASIVSSVLVFKYVSPPASSYMVREWVEGQHAQQYQWVPMDKIAHTMPLAVIASEDQKYLSHWGIDVQAIYQAVREYQSGERLRGASTISQQTVKNLFFWNSPSWWRKIAEVPITPFAEWVWGKPRMMEIYLNVAEFGPGIYGVEAASQHYFNRSAAQLTQQQAARLAAVLPNPKRFKADSQSGYVPNRVGWITRQMRQLGGVGYVKGLY